MTNITKYGNIALLNNEQMTKIYNLLHTLSKTLFKILN